MRKDVKMGFGVGGVLLAVIIVAILVVHRNQNKELVRIDTSGKTAPGVDVDGTSPADSAKSADSSQAPAPDANKQPDRKEPSAAPEDKWEAPFASATSEPPKSQLGHGSAAKPKQSAAPEVAATDQSSQDDSARPSASTASHSTDTARTHTVQAGETLSGIAMTAYGDSRQYKAILAANPGLDAAKLKPGTVLQLPALSKAKSSAKTTSAKEAASAGAAPASDGKTYVVQKDDSLYAIARKLYGSGARQDEIYTLNKQVIGNDSTKLKPGMVLKLPAVPAAH